MLANFIMSLNKFFLIHIKEVNFYTRTYEERCTGNSIYREKTSFFDDSQITIESKQTTTLDILLNGRQFDLIKIDVQGSEIDIINGEILTNVSVNV